jgi:phage shock protein A
MLQDTKQPDDLSGMDQASAKAYIVRFMAALKLYEKDAEKLEEELALWESRATLARSKDALDLAALAEKEADSLRAKKAALNTEIETLKAQIDIMRKQLSGLAARERSVDPDMLEQELLISTGYFPGDEEKVKAEQTLKTLEKNAEADSALAALKAKMGSE